MSRWFVAQVASYHSYTPAILSHMFVKTICMHRCLFPASVAMEVIGTPDSKYLDGWANAFGSILYILGGAPKGWTATAKMIRQTVSKGEEDRKEYRVYTKGAPQVRLNRAVQYKSGNISARFFFYCISVGHFQLGGHLPPQGDCSCAASCILYVLLLPWLGHCGWFNLLTNVGVVTGKCCLG